MSIQAVSTKSITKTTSTSTKSASSSSDTHGLLFAGKNNVGKSQNDVVYANLDSKTREVIASTIGNNAWVNPAKIAKALEKAGVTATTGKTSDANYLEITNSDGSKSRIWDVGSDGGIGTQDIDLNTQLASLKSDIQSAASASATTSAKTSTANSTATDSTTVDPTDTTEALLSTENTSTENTTSNSKAGINNTSLTKDEYYSKLDDLVEELKQDNNYKNYSDSQLEDLAQEKLAEMY